MDEFTGEDFRIPGAVCETLSQIVPRVRQCREGGFGAQDRKGKINLVK